MSLLIGILIVGFAFVLSALILLSFYAWFSQYFPFPEATHTMKSTSVIVLFVSLAVIAIAVLLILWRR